MEEAITVDCPATFAGPMYAFGSIVIGFWQNHHKGGKTA